MQGLLCLTDAPELKYQHWRDLPQTAGACVKCVSRLTGLRVNVNRLVCVNMLVCV